MKIKKIFICILFVFLHCEFYAIGEGFGKESVKLARDEFIEPVLNLVRKMLQNVQGTNKILQNSADKFEEIANETNNNIKDATKILADLQKEGIKLDLSQAAIDFKKIVDETLKDADKMMIKNLDYSSYKLIWIGVGLIILAKLTFVSPPENASNQEKRKWYAKHALPLLISIKELIFPTFYSV